MPASFGNLWQITNLSDFQRPKKPGSSHDLKLAKAQIRHCHAAFEISFVCNLIKKKYVSRKLSSYRIMKNKMYATFDKEESNTENTGLKFVAFKLTAVRSDCCLSIRTVCCTGPGLREGSCLYWTLAKVSNTINTKYAAEPGYNVMKGTNILCRYKQVLF